MATDITRRQENNVRAHIAKYASDIGTRLARFALDIQEPTPGTGELRDIDMSQAQVAAAKAVLDKSVASLQSIDSTHVIDGPAALSESQAIERLSILLTKHPELARVLKPPPVHDSEVITPAIGTNE